ncbi:MAG: hypothetical protein GYA56_06735 [Geobacteraceae bacterium]|nr:hypothetical protein [Geobacteraceae bacterium]
MPVPIPGTVSPVLSVILIPVAPYSLKGISVEDTGHIIGIHTGPRAIVIGGRIPDISEEEIKEVIEEEQIIGDTHRRIKAQLGGLDE